MGTMDTVSHKAQRAAFSVALDAALKHIENDTSKGLLDVLDISQKFMGDTFKKETFEAIRAYIADPENKWMQFVDHHLHRLKGHKQQASGGAAAGHKGLHPLLGGQQPRVPGPHRRCDAQQQAKQGGCLKNRPIHASGHAITPWIWQAGRRASCIW